MDNIWGQGDVLLKTPGRVGSIRRLSGPWGIRCARRMVSRATSLSVPYPSMGTLIQVGLRDVVTVQAIYQGGDSKGGDSTVAHPTLWCTPKRWLPGKENDCADSNRPANVWLTTSGWLSNEVQ